MRVFGLVFIILCLIIACTSQKEKVQTAPIGKLIYKNLSENESFPKHHYKRVVSYAFNADSTKSIVNDGRIATTAIEDSVVMTQKQINEFIYIVNDSLSYQDEGFRCFVPRWGIVFYDMEDTPIAYTNICFTCNNIDAHPKIEGENFSTIGRKRLEAMCSSMKLKYCE